MPVIGHEENKEIDIDIDIDSILTVNTKTLCYTQHTNTASDVIKCGVLTAHFLSITVFQDVTMCHLMNDHCHF